jgi:hypothetical protein
MIIKGYPALTALRPFSTAVAALQDHRGGYTDEVAAFRPGGRRHVRASENQIPTRMAVRTRMTIEKSKGTVDAVSQDTMGSIALISDKYAQRAQNNYARVGQAFGSDPLIRGDLDLCGRIAGEVSKKLPNLMD